MALPQAVPLSCGGVAEVVEEKEEVTTRVVVTVGVAEVTEPELEGVPVPLLVATVTLGQL